MTEKKQTKDSEIYGYQEAFKYAHDKHILVEIHVNEKILDTNIVGYVNKVYRGFVWIYDKNKIIREGRYHNVSIIMKIRDITYIRIDEGEE